MTAMQTINELEELIRELYIYEDQVFGLNVAKLLAKVKELKYKINDISKKLG